MRQNLLSDRQTDDVKRNFKREQFTIITNFKGMPKVLCIISLSISSIVFLLFLLSLIFGVPFTRDGGILVHIGFIIGSITIGVLSVFTYLEVR
ncbi:MAG: hypothetical protein LBT09_04580 [Planctomycetaceae bacterium]|nr:hypothetical protein [Planctomycetaceae bacterium]